MCRVEHGQEASYREDASGVHQPCEPSKVGQRREEKSDNGQYDDDVAHEGYRTNSRSMAILVDRSGAWTRLSTVVSECQR